MIPLNLPAMAEATEPFITRLRVASDEMDHPADSFLVIDDAFGTSFCGPHGLVAIDGIASSDIDGDVILVQPDSGRAERLLRHGSLHNTLLVTERCDQLCVMCSQPPKKTHVDRFALFEEACMLAEVGSVIGLTGGEPTLYKEALLTMVERVLSVREDLEFHILSNAQHFDDGDIERLRQPLYRRVSWGIPLYAPEATLHDDIVCKEGAFDRLRESFDVLLMSGARIELRTVLLSLNLELLPKLARHVTAQLRFIESWSIMQLENIGFAKNKWGLLFVDHSNRFEPIAAALDHAALHGINARLFNFPRCTVPAAYREMAPASISDWKRKYLPACEPCAERSACCGFFEWHPDTQAIDRIAPL